MRKFVVMAVAARWTQDCGHKRCLRQNFLDRWYDYMFSVNGVERLQRHTRVLHRFYQELNQGLPATLDVKQLSLS